MSACDLMQGGTLLLNGKTPQQLGVPNWRTQVTYVPQSRTQQKGTPSELYFAAQVCMMSPSTCTVYVACVLLCDTCVPYAAIQGPEGTSQGRPASTDCRAGLGARRPQPALGGALGAPPSPRAGCPLASAVIVHL